MLPDTLGHIFDVPLRLAPSSVAVIQGDTTLTYRELDAWCNRAARFRHMHRAARSCSKNGARARTPPASTPATKPAKSAI